MAGIPTRPRNVIVWLTPLLAAAVCAFPAGAVAAASSPGEGLSRQVLYQDGQAGRLLLSGGWRIRMDDADQGLAQHFERDRRFAHWGRVSMPFNWNAQDNTHDAPSIGWFRSSFTVKEGGAWNVRFESVTGHATVWLNGRLIGTHDGAYLPFELRARSMRKGRNWLTIRVDSHHGPDDLTFWRTDPTSGAARYGWWNFGGISREVYLRHLDHADATAISAIPKVRCAQSCSASVRVSTRVTSVSSRSWRYHVGLDVAGRRILFHPRRLAPGRSSTYTTTLSVPRPRVWSPEHPTLYPLHARVYVDDPATHSRAVAGRDLHVGLRTLRRDSSGHLFLNDKPLLLHGASFHEDTRFAGSAWGPGQRLEIARELTGLHANVVRSHYPLHPGFLELCDRLGILVWDEVPVYQTPNETLAIPARRATALRWFEEMIARDHDHASVFAYAASNELPAVIGAGQAAYLDSAVSAAHALDPTRFVAIDRYPDGRYRSYDVLRRFDLHGINEYFGWYGGSDADAGSFLDSYHATYPQQGIVITEFGAEANRDGDALEKGTFGFQQRYLLTHLAIFAQRPYVLGAMVWALRDFRVQPGWTGGNPQPAPPWNYKGLVTRFGERKPAYTDVSAVYGGVQNGRWPSGLGIPAPKARSSRLPATSRAFSPSR
jgi:beta-glucuronidase